MKILAVSDKECPAFWDYYQPGRLQEYDLILACGDLKASYLSFLVTMARCPVLYVPGNHDSGYEKHPPEGCDNIDGHLVTYNGLRILGLGGCKRYRPGPHQYTERQMRQRVRRLRWPLRRSKGVDIIISHAPPQGLGDSDDRAHLGFEIFRQLIARYRPQYFIHGHVHMNYGLQNKRSLTHLDTTVLNAYERYSFEIEDKPVPPRHQGQVIYKTRFRPNDPPPDLLLP